MFTTTRNTIAALHADGLSLKEIAARVGLSRARVHQIVQELRADAGEPPDWTPLQLRILAELRADSAQQRTYEQIASALGCSTGPVERVARLAGIRRTRGWRPGRKRK